VHTQTPIDYDWDPAKATANLRKHGVRFADAALSLEDPAGRTVPDPDASDEARFLFLGADPSGQILVTVFTARGRMIRIISSRRASRAERLTYETR
jgi:uncharacterized DUF497 family protein